MSQIDNIVTVNISRQTTQIDIAAFDIPLILVEMDENMELQFTDRVRTYTSLAAVAEDFPTDHKAYIISSKLLGGDIKPATFKIGKKKGGETYTEAIHKVQEFDDTWYALIADTHGDENINSIANTIQGMRKIYFTSTDSSDALNQGLNPVYTASVVFDIRDVKSGDKLSVRIAGETYEAEYTGTDFSSFEYVGNGAGNFRGVFDLDSVGGLTVEDSEPFVISKAFQEVEDGYTGEVPSEDISITDPIGLDIGQRLKAKGMFRTVVLYSKTSEEDWPEASWVGSQIVEVPGSNTWEYKQLPGVTVSRLTDSEISLLESRNYNYYIPIKGVNVTRRGKAVGEGEWVDIVILVDWIHARMQEQIFYRLVNTRKIPFSDSGFTMIENEMRSVLSQAQSNGGIDQYTVTVPKVLEIPEMERARRNAEGFEFVARAQGAVSTVTIRGTLTV